MDSTLNIYINSAGRQYLLDTKQRIGIIRSYPDSTDLKYVCYAFDPFGDHNILTFYDDWQGIIGLKAPANLTKFTYNTGIDAEFGNIYNVIDSGFENTKKNGPSDFIGITNSRTSTSPLYTGIAQKINDDFCVSDVSITSVNTTGFYPFSSELWIFTASGIVTDMAISSSMLIPETMKNRAVVINKYLSISLTGNTDVYFDNKTNVFVPGSFPLVPLTK